MLVIEKDGESVCDKDTMDNQRGREGFMIMKIVVNTDRRLYPIFMSVRLSISIESDDFIF